MCFKFRLTSMYVIFANQKHPVRWFVHAHTDIVTKQWREMHMRSIYSDLSRIICRIACILLIQHVIFVLQVFLDRISFQCLLSFSIRIIEKNGFLWLTLNRSLK